MFSRTCYNKIYTNREGDTNMKKAVAYLRVSTDGQSGEDRFGLESQKQQILSYAGENDIEILTWFTEQVSGASDTRPVFDQIIYGDVTNPPYEYVIVAKSDRVARDINIYYYYKMMLKKKDITLISIAEDFGQFGVFSSMLEAFTICVAEMERENITKRTSMGRRVKAKQGGYAGGNAPYGYTIENGSLVVNPEEASVVLDIFAMHDQGWSYRQIAESLERQGVLSRSGKPMRHSVVQKIVTNRPTYQGKYKYGDMEWVEGQHEAIMP